MRYNMACADAEERAEVPRMLHPLIILSVSLLGTLSGTRSGTAIPFQSPLTERLSLSIESLMEPKSCFRNP